MRIAIHHPTKNIPLVDKLYDSIEEAEEEVTQKVKYWKRIAKICKNKNLPRLLAFKRAIFVEIPSIEQNFETGLVYIESQKVNKLPVGNLYQTINFCGIQKRIEDNMDTMKNKMWAKM